MRPFRLLSLSLGLCAALLHAQGPQTIPGDLLIMLKPGESAQSVVDAMRASDGGASGLRVVKELSAPMRAWLLHYEPAQADAATMLRAVRSHHSVLVAQNNHVVHDRQIPNDPAFGQQWHHTNIDSPDAWDLTTGGTTATGDSIVVCIIENSDLPHPDLIGNAWFNRGEIPGNNVDDDGNGYVDDHRGWNPGGNDDNVYGGGHGTQVAGMIGAKGNNGALVAGANWDVHMMVVTRQGIAEDAVVESYTYPLIMRRLYNESNGEQGAFVVATNASWGIDNADHTEFPIWCAMYDTLGAAGILSCGATANNNVDIDVVDDMPTGCESAFMVSVTATNDADMRTFSGYGATTVDVGAPGEDVFTTTMGGGTGSTSGTSFASPLTAGVIGLLYSAPCPSLMDLVHSDPQAGALYVRDALFNGVEQVGNLPGNTTTGGRINSNNSLQLIMNGCGDCPRPYNLEATNTSLTEAMLAWGASSADVFNISIWPADGQGGPTLTLTDHPGASYTVGDLETCKIYGFAVSAVCGPDTISVWSDTLYWTSEGCCTAPLTYSGAAIDANSALISWSSVLAAQTYSIEYTAPATGATTTLDGATGTSVEVGGLTPCTLYEVRMRSLCSGVAGSDWGPVVTFTTPGCGQCIDAEYCASVSADASTEWIERVQLNTLDNESGNNDGFAAFTDQGTTLTIGEPYPITLIPGFSFFAYAEYWRVWIDLDNDAQFESPSELVFDAGETSNDTVTGTLIVPGGSAPGSTRMRVIMKYDGAAEGCEDGYDYGETEDYCVELQGADGITVNALPAGPVFFPNPADRDIFFDIPVTGTGSYTIEVLDNTGKLIVRRAIDRGRVTVTTAWYDNGLYVYRILRDGVETGRGKFEVLH